MRCLICVLSGIVWAAGCSEHDTPGDASVLDANNADTVDTTDASDAIQVDTNNAPDVERDARNDPPDDAMDAADVSDDVSDAMGSDAVRAAIDMSFLLRPTPEMAFGADSMGGHGVVVPRLVFNEVRLSGGLPLASGENEDTIYDSLKVVGVRLDPCFVEGPIADRPCTSQVRVVLQPVMRMEEDLSTVTTRDAAIHAFYSVPLSELRVLANDLAAARATGPTEVGVVASAELASALVSNRIGGDRLTRIAFMTVIGDFAWTFGQFDVADVEPGGVLVRGQQTLRSGGMDVLNMSIRPAPEVEVDAVPYLEMRTRDMMTDASVAAALAAFERLLDPSEHNPGTVDCASCHVSTVALRFSSRGAPRPPNAYDDTRNLRMFGWFGIEESISPRVVAETEIALRFLEEE